MWEILDYVMIFALGLMAIYNLKRALLILQNRRDAREEEE